MPITWEWQDKVERMIRPYGKQRWQDFVFDHARKALQGKNKAAVLEAGCGRQCWTSRQLREEGFDLHVVGVDIDPACLENKDVDVAKVASLTQIPLGSESTDLVMCGWVLEHLDAPEEIFGELYRVLKPGGLVILWTPNRYNPAVTISSLTPHRFHLCGGLLASRG